MRRPQSYMKARTAQILMTVLTALAGMTVLLKAQLLKAQMTGGQARAAQAQASGAAARSPAAPAAQATGTGSTAVAPKPAGPRRDPFRPLIQPKTATDALPIRLPAGKPGLVIGQLTIQGIVRNIDGKWMAVVDNKTKRSYFLYERDELYNGVVSSITADSVTFEERSLDTAGRTRTREVVKRIGS